MAVEEFCHANASQPLNDEQIRRLKAARNELAPISKLPPEILGIIFSFASSERTCISPIFPCYYFTHVSQAWRSVALNTASLWLVLPDNIPWARTMLERSKGGDLVIKSSFSVFSLNRRSMEERKTFLKEVFTNHAPRIRELDLIWTGESDLTTIFENVPQSSLRLHSLKFSCEHEGRAFPTGVLETGSLRTLMIRNCDGLSPWLFPHPLVLTRLDLSDIPTRPPLLKFLEMLRGLASLEVLIMEDSLPLADDANSLVVPVKLPASLRYLEFSTNDYMEVVSILPLIIIPATTTLDFHVANGQPEQFLDELATSFSTFFSRLGPETNLSYSKLGVISVANNHLCLRAWKDDDDFDENSGPDFKLVVNHFTHPLHSAQLVLRSIFPSLPLFYITTLRLDIVPVRSLLEDIFGWLPHLQTVIVVRECTRDLIQALLYEPKNGNAENPSDSSVSFPALRSLWFQGFPRGTCDVEDLQDCLAERRRRGAGLLKLRLSGCYALWRGGVERLREIVDDVELDGEDSDRSVIVGD